MKKAIYLILFFSMCSFSQEVQILNKNNNNPIPYANVDFMNGNGIASDKNGRFQFSFKSTDSVKVYSIGFVSKKVAVIDFKKTLKIFLEEKITSLDEITIKNKKTQVLKHKKGVSNINIVIRDFTYDELVVTYIPFPDNISDKREVKIKNIIVNTTGLRSKKRKYYPFKINLYAVNAKTKYPNTADSLITGIITSRKKGTSKKVKINVQALDLILPKEGIFVGFETLSEKDYPKDELYKTVKSFTSGRNNEYNAYGAAVKTIKINSNSSNNYSYSHKIQRFKNSNDSLIAHRYWKRDKDFIYDLTIEIEY